MENEEGGLKIYIHLPKVDERWVIEPLPLEADDGGYHSINGYIALYGHDGDVLYISEEYSDKELDYIKSQFETSSWGKLSNPTIIRVREVAPPKTVRAPLGIPPAVGQRIIIWDGHSDMGQLVWRKM